MSNGYFQHPCRKRISTRQQDLNSDDLNITVTTEPGENPGTFNVMATLTPKPNFGDVAQLTNADAATLFDAPPSESSSYGYDSINSIEGALAISFAGVEQTEANVNNSWKLVIADLQIVAKDGQTFTIPTLSKTFPSPL